MKNLNFLVTLWPSFPHFKRFSQDNRLAGIRLNSAMMRATELEQELKIIQDTKSTVPLWFDVKGWQLRVEEAVVSPDHLELKINHKIKVETPIKVFFKAGADCALLKEIKNGNYLIFEGGPNYLVSTGESLHIRSPHLEVLGNIFTDKEIQKIEKTREAGFNKYFLSYVERQRDIDQFRELVGDSEIIAKIENTNGLNFVANKFKPQKNLSLMAARGDLYIELDRPHHILNAMRLIIEKDKNGYVGSRLLLSVVRDSVPECCDFSDLAWLHDIGYRNFMLCDELCLKEELMATCVNIMSAFDQTIKSNNIVMSPVEDNTLPPPSRIKSFWKEWGEPWLK